MLSTVNIKHNFIRAIPFSKGNFLRAPYPPNLIFFLPPTAAFQFSLVTLPPLGTHFQNDLPPSLELDVIFHHIYANHNLNPMTPTMTPPPPPPLEVTSWNYMSACKLDHFHVQII